MRLSIAFIVVLFAAQTGFAGYSVEVNTAPELFDVKRLAIAPAICPEDFDCLWIERVLIEKFLLRGKFLFDQSSPSFEEVKRNLKLDPMARESQSPHATVIIPADSIRRAMFNEGLASFNEAARKRIAESLKIDAFVQVLVHGSSSRSEGGAAIFIGNTAFFHESDVKNGSVELIVISNTDQKMLLRGIGFGESGLRTERGILGKILADMLKEAYESYKPRAGR